MKWTEKQEEINTLYNLMKNPKKTDYQDDFKVGVDLGTADIALVVLDKAGKPIAGSLEWASVLKDGLVVDYLGAVEKVKKLKSEVELRLGREITRAATAIPPGTTGNNAEVCGHVLEAAGIELTSLVDEPTAAATALDIKDGAVVDIGGGTTGISILQNGEVIYTADEATGGTHLTLVLAGSYKIGYDEAEEIKKNHEKHAEIMPILTPVIDKMASIVANHIAGHNIDKIYLVGGTTALNGFEKVFQKLLQVNIYKPNHPILVTPLGIALHSE